MLKRLLISLAILAGLAAPVHAAGTISFSLSQQLDQFGKPLSGCKFYTIQAATTSTPQNAYQDADLTLALPNPMTCDAAGRLPQFFLADGSIKIRLTDKNGVTQIVADGILVIGPSSGGGGGGGGVDPTTILSTGDIKTSYGTGTLSGFVRLNGRTIGSASSGATERANADTEALFNYLWQADPNLVVSSGRGASSAADWAANKTITLPDARGRVLAGLDDMGASAAGRLTTLSPNGTTLGAAGGAQNVLMSQSSLPNATLAVSGSVTVTSTSTKIAVSPSLASTQYTTGAGGFVFYLDIGASLGSISSTGPASLTSASINGGVTQTPLSLLQPTLAITTYVKL